MPSALPDPTPPPSPEDLERLPTFPDGRALRLQIAELSLELHGRAPDLWSAAKRRYGPFASSPNGAPADLKIRVRDAQRPHFLPPSPQRENRLYRLSILHQDGGLRLVAHGFAGWFRLQSGEGTMALCHGSFDPPERALENYVRACVAWMALQRGGFLIHSASIVRDDEQAFLFFGASGAGKSTLAAMNREGRVISDDLSVILPGPDGKLHVAGAPFRGTYTGGEPVTGLYPVHSAYRLHQDTETYVVKPSQAIAMADLFANLAFVVDQMGQVPGLTEQVAERLARLPTYHLHFRKDPDFWRAIDAYHAEGS